jgi:hypothetical protein
MGFLEEVKITLSTESADRTAHSLSECSWTLKDDVSPPNPNYKIKLTVPNMNIPSSFQKVGPERGNDTMVIAYSQTNTPMNLPEDISQGRFAKITICPVETSDPTTFITALRRTMWDTLRRKNANNTDFEKMDFKPWPLFDTDSNNGFPTITMVSVTWDNSAARNQEDGMKDLEQPFSNDPNMVFGSNAISFKILTQADLPNIPDSSGITERDLRLANVCGFSKNVSYDEFSYANRGDTHNVVGNVDASNFATEFGIAYGGCVRASRKPDLLGTKFIKVLTNLPITNIDPYDKAYRRMLGVIPVTDIDLTTETTYLSGELQNPQYNTLAQSKLDTIQITLMDDHNNYLKPHADWYLELSVMFEEPIALDAYRGISSVIGNPAAVEFGASADPEVYRRMQNELKRAYENLDEQENENRDYQSGRIRAR